jgi:hypothetical protein
MTAQLTVHNAEIATAAVEIRTLTISGKQVTLAVFRQIPEKALYGVVEDGQIWGFVNYCPGKTCSTWVDGWGDRRDRGPHRHVIWQDGQELCRATVYEYDLDGKPTRGWPRVHDLPQLFIAV